MWISVMSSINDLSEVVGVKTCLVWIHKRKKEDKIKTIIGNSWGLWLKKWEVIETLTFFIFLNNKIQYIYNLMESSKCWKFIIPFREKKNFRVMSLSRQKGMGFNVQGFVGPLLGIQGVCQW